MPVSNAKYVDLTDEVVVDVPMSKEEGAPTEPCLVRFRPNMVTPKFSRQMAREATNSEKFFEMFCQMVTFMDVVGPLYDEDEEGNPVEVLADGVLVPMEPNYISLCSENLLGTLANGIFEHIKQTADPKGTDQAPVPISSKGSPRGSFNR